MKGSNSMKKRMGVILSLLFATITTCALASCGRSKWEYSKKDASEFIELNAKVSKKDSEKYEMDITSENPVFKNIVYKDNILLFDLSKVNNVKGYMKYEDVKDHLIPISSTNESSNQAITIEFFDDDVTEIGVLVHKDSLKKNSFAYGVGRILSNKEELQTKYEEEIIKKKGGWDTANKGIQMANYITSSILGYIANNPSVFAGGIFGLATTLGNAFLSSGPTLADVSKQLGVIDAKIDAISNQIDANQKEILDEFVRTQAMIDEVKVNQYNQNIQAFQTSYVKPIEDYLLIYKDSIEQYFKKYVSEPEIVCVYYGKDDILMKSEDDITNAEKFELSIPEFKNSIDYLKKNKEIVDDKFPLAMNKDIKAALNGVALPKGRSLDLVIEDIYKTICDSVNQEVLTKENEVVHRDVLQFVNNFVSYAKAIAGINFESVINSYVSRLEYIYNFSFETKKIVRDLFAAIKLNLDQYLCVAQAACIAQKINYTKEIGQAYMNAADYISSKYDGQMKVDDNYSYIAKNKIKGDLYHAYAEVSFTNCGNNPTFHASFELRNNLDYDGANIHGKIVDVNSIRFVNYSNMRAISTRYSLLRNICATKEDTLIHYLAANNIVSYDGIDLLYRVFNSGRTLYKLARILTSYNIRDLRDSDSFKLRCTCCGNNDGYYFNLGQEYKYRYSDFNCESEYWSGKMAYGDIISSETGALDKENLVSAYARYSESHWYWSDDEHWGFNNDVFGEYFFIFSIV